MMPPDTVPVHLPYLRRLLAEKLSEAEVRKMMKRIREKPEEEARDVMTISNEVNAMARDGRRGVGNPRVPSPEAGGRRLNARAECCPKCAPGRFRRTTQRGGIIGGPSWIREPATSGLEDRLQPQRFQALTPRWQVLRGDVVRRSDD